MNQIPNIEETHNTREVVDDEANRIYVRTSENPSGELLTGKEIRDWYHQELQKAYEQGVQDELNRESQNIDAVIAGMIKKARQDWLREEIVRLEKSRPTPPNILVPDESPIAHALREGEYQALQTIIDRYQKELNQDKQ